jgi:hypothetical protein
LGGNKKEIIGPIIGHMSFAVSHLSFKKNKPQITQTNTDQKLKRATKRPFYSVLLCVYLRDLRLVFLMICGLFFLNDK